MSAPYKVREFVATSGNSCRLKIWAPQPSGCQPVDVTWDHSVSQEDITECNDWFLKNEAPRGTCFVANIVQENDDVRESLIKSILAESS